MSIREAFEKSDLCKSMVGNDNLKGWNLKRNPDDAVRYPGEYQWSRLEAAWQGFQAGAAWRQEEALESAAKVVESANGASAHPASPESCALTAATIRAMKP